MADPWAEFNPTGPTATSGGVFVPAPGAAAKEGREQRSEGRAEQSLGNEEARLGLSQEDNARANRKEGFGNAAELRKEFRALPEYKFYETVIRQFNSALKTESTPTGDQALIYAYAKMLDPNSVVREQEFNTAASADSALGKAVAKLSKELGLDDSGLLRDEVRARVRREMLNLTADYRKSYERSREDFSGIAERNGLKLEDVIGSHLGQTYGKDIREGWRKAFPDGDKSQSGRSELKVAEGKSFSTEQDKAIATKLQDAWNGGASPDEINALSQELTGKPIPPEGMEAMRRNQGGSLNFSPASSGKQDADPISGGIDGDIQSALAGSVRGYMANMPEELGAALGMNPEEIQAALDAYEKKNPVANFAGEMVGQLVSPAGKLVKGGKVARIASDAAYGGIFGAGEGDPDASLEERALGAGVGTLTGGAASYGASKLFGPKAAQLADELPVGVEPPILPEKAANEALKEAGDEVAPEGGDAAQIATLARQAIGVGPGSGKAKRELARMAKVNPEAKAAADRLGVELPVDVISDSAQLSSLVGMARSQVGSQAEAAWKAKASEVAVKADDALAELGATADLAQASDDVFQRLNAGMQSLQREGDALRKEVDSAIDVQSRVEATNLQGALGQLINDLGGLKEAKQAFTGEERKLLAMLGEGETANTPTYARLVSMRQQIGRALNKNEGPWTDAPRANLEKYYAALADDQIAHIERVSGTEAADKMRASNTLFKKMYDARADMQEAFGKELDKSLAPLLNRALTQGSKGDIANLNKLISRVPEDMRGGLLASGLLAQAQGKGAQGGFSFANYAKVYRGLRDNKPVYQQFAKALGPTGDRVLADIYAISRRMAEADSNVLRTGKANQALLALNAERLVSKVFKTTAVRAAGTVATGWAGGPIAAGLAHAAQETLGRGGAKNAEKVHALLSSPEFRGLIDKIAADEGVDPAINKLASSKSFASFLPASFTDRRNWIRSAMALGSSSALPETPTIEVGNGQ